MYRIPYDIDINREEFECGNRVELFNVVYCPCSGSRAQALLKAKRATAEKAKAHNKGAKEFYRSMMSAYAREHSSMEFHAVSLRTVCLTFEASDT